jgi:hypothetical protein
MKKKKLMAIMFCTGFFAVALLLTSCGGSGGETEGGKTEANFKKSPKNEFLGDLVNIAGETRAKIADNKSQFEEARAKNNEKYADNSDKREQNWRKLYEQNEERQKKIVEEATAAIEKEMTTLIGKDLPYECDDNLGVEFTDCKISRVNKPSYDYLTLTFTYKVKASDPAILKNISPLTNPIRSSFVDANGNTLLDNGGNAMSQNISFNYDMLKQLKNGETIEREGWVKLEPGMANFAKIKFEKNE